METLRAVRDLELADWAIGAGFVRSVVWDRLHGFAARNSIADIDVLFFDRGDPSRETEMRITHQLIHALPDRPWSVRNQARMHVRNNDRPYLSTLDAISFWLETPTCVAVRLEPDDAVNIFAPHGLEDLIGMRVRPTQSGLKKIDQYGSRLRRKNWLAVWPQLKIEGLE